MISAMLCKGRLSDFVPIGQDGAPVYQHADAFRDAVSRIPGRGEALSRFLAKPKFSPDYTRVEWFVSFAPAVPERGYRVIPWKNARADERDQALKELQSFAFELEGFADELLQSSGDKNARLFAHYLTGQGGSSRLPAVHFPGPEYIYIVDGQPVLTFWGFLAQGSRTGLDPFACLRPPRKAAPAAAGAAAAAAGATAASPALAAEDNEAGGDSSAGSSVLPPEDTAAGPDNPPADQAAAPAEPFLPDPEPENDPQPPEPEVPPAPVDWSTPPGSPGAAPQDANWSASPGSTSFSRHIAEEKTSSVNNTTAADWSTAPGAGTAAAAAQPGNAGCLWKGLKILLLILLLLLLLWLAWRLLAGTGLPWGGGSSEPARQDLVLPPEEKTGEENPPAAEPAADQGAENTALPLREENVPAVPAGTREPVAADPAAAVVEPAAAASLTDPQNDPLAAVVDPTAAQGVLPEATAQLPETANTAVPEPQTAENTAVLPPVVPEALQAQNAQVPEQSAQSADPTAAGAAVTAQNVPAAAGGELMLPGSGSTAAAAAAGGNLSFLEGNWKAVSGMMDTSTGRPLNLSYTYNNGSGELVVERQDKSRCTVRANPSYAEGKLTIEAAGRAVCPDNSSYNLPRIICQPAADGRADCQAYYSEDNHFPIKIQGN